MIVVGSLAFVSYEKPINRNEIKYLWDEIAFEKKGIFFNDIDKIISNLQNIFENKDNIMFKASSKINLSRIIDELNIAKTIRKIA